MGWIRKFRKQESELDGELRAFLDLLTAQKERSGLDPAAARREALLELGGIEVVKEHCRDVRRFSWLTGLWQDLRYALRSLRKSPGFVSVAVLSLALGIGANAAIFGVFYAAFLSPLPYPDSERLYALNRPGFGVMTPELVLWRGAGAGAFEGVAGWDDTTTTITGVGSPERLDVATVSANLLGVLRVSPFLGRGFSEADGRPGMPPTALLTYEIWQKKFGGDAGTPGRVVMLDGKATTILGVLPPDFRFPGNYHPDLLAISPLPAQPDWRAETVEGFWVIGRLRVGATPEMGRAVLATVSSVPEMSHFLKNFGARNRGITLMPLQEAVYGKGRPVLVMLLGAVSLLVLIAFVNVASLQLGRASARSREIALRTALGASRLRLARLLVIENLTLTLAAGAAGLLVAAGLLQLLQHSEGLPVAGLRDLRPGWILAGASLALAAMGGLAIGLAPAFFGSRPEINQTLKNGSTGAIGRRGAWIRPLLVVTQVALALVMLLGSGLLLRSLATVLSVAPGFKPAGVLTAMLQLPMVRYTSDAQQKNFVQTLLDRLSGLPGVESAAVTNTVPLSNYSLGGAVRCEGEPAPQHDRRRSSAILGVTPGYFETIGIRMVSGQGFSGTGRSVVVNERFAQAFFGTRQVLGRQVQFTGDHIGDDKPWWTIVGVAEDTRTQGLEEPAQPELFVPESQLPSRRVHVVIRTAGNPFALAQGLRAAVWSIDEDLPVTGIATMEQMLSRHGAGRRNQTWLLSAFAILALCLAGIGIFGVVAEAVQRRTGEIGLRMALGARPGEVLRMVMRRSFALSAAGTVCGIAAGAFLTRYLSSQLFGVKPGDPLTFAGAALVLLMVALLAGYLPARRAVRIDPVAALRCE